MSSFSFEVRRKGKPGSKPKDALAVAVRRLGALNPAALNELATKGLEGYTHRVGNAMRARHGLAWPGGTGPASLSRRSGRGLSALTGGRVHRQGNGIAAVFTLPKYLAHQEFGVVSTAKGKFLTIPMPAALNPDGTPKKRSARQWQGTFLAKGKKGQWIICTKRGRQTVPLYVLKPTVRITARLGLRKVMKKELNFFARSLAMRVNQLLKETW